MHIYTDMTDNESVEREIAIKNWSSSDLGIIMLMVAVVVATLNNFFFNTCWVQFVERSIIIVPVIIYLITQSNLHFIRSLLKPVGATTSFLKRMTLNNVTTTDSVVRRMTMTIISFTINRTYSVTVAAIMFAVKKPIINCGSFGALAYIGSIIIFNHLPYGSRTIEAACLSLVILTDSFNHMRVKTLFARIFVPYATLIIASCFGFGCCALIMNGVKMNHLIVIIGGGFCILMFCFSSLLHDFHLHEIVTIAVTLSIIIFTHDLVLSLVEIPDIINTLLYVLLMLVLTLYYLLHAFVLGVSDSIVRYRLK